MLDTTALLTETAAARAAALDRKYRHGSTLGFLAAMLRWELPFGRLAVVSSFGADSAVLLHLVAGIDRTVPVLFIDTGKLFGETLRYRDQLAERLRLTDMRTLRPDAADMSAHDPDGILWASASDRCCHLRKVLPLERALTGFEAWVSGRKRFQSGTRAALPLVEADPAGRLKLNPLAGWRAADLKKYAIEHNLPPHPLEADGFLSIGCLPCTDRVAPGEDARAGRWRGRSKTECGIHRRPATIA